MRSHYNIILFDGSYFLFRNQAISRGINESKLAGSFIQSIVKVVRDNNIKFDVGFIAFDRGPYIRTEILKGRYKDDREKFSESDISGLDVKITETTDESEKAKIQAQRDHARESLDRLYQRLNTIKLLKNLDEFGLKLLQYKGYEADDLARIVVDTYSKDYSILLCSVDSDWVGMVNDNTDYYRILHKGRTEFYDKNTLMQDWRYREMRELGLDELGLRRYLQVIEALGDSHNNMRNCIDPNHPLVVSEIIANWDNLDKLTESHNFDAESFRKQYSTFEIEKFPDYTDVVEDILHLKYNLKSLNEFNGKFIYELCTGITSNYYSKLYENICNYSLLQL